MSEEKSPPFSRESIKYTFKTKNMKWRIIDFGDKYAAVEETRKNGQEDTHMFAELYVKDGKWTMSDDDRDDIARYSWADEPDNILAHFDEHGPPTQSDPLERARVIRKTMGSQLHNPGDMLDHLIKELEAGRDLTVEEAREL